MPADNSIFPGQEDYAAWVGRKNNYGAGGMSPDQLGWGQYQQEITGHPYQPGGSVSAPIAPVNQPQTTPTGTEFNDTTSPPVAALPTPTPIVTPPVNPIDPSGGTGFVPPIAPTGSTPAKVAQPPIAGNTTMPTDPSNGTGFVPPVATSNPMNTATTQGTPSLGANAVQRKLAAFGGVQ